MTKYEYLEILRKKLKAKKDKEPWSHASIAPLEYYIDTMSDADAELMIKKDPRLVLAFFCRRAEKVHGFDLVARENNSARDTSYEKAMKLFHEYLRK